MSTPETFGETSRPIPTEQLLLMPEVQARISENFQPIDDRYAALKQEGSTVTQLPSLVDMDRAVVVEAAKISTLGKATYLVHTIDFSNPENVTATPRKIRDAMASRNGDLALLLEPQDDQDGAVETFVWPGPIARSEGAQPGYDEHRVEYLSYLCQRLGIEL